MNNVTLVGILTLLLTLGGVVRVAKVVASEPTNKGNVIGLVAEFIDPDKTGLGKSLGSLLWREVLTAIGHQAGIEVSITRSPAPRFLPQQLLADVLGTTYHQTAEKIARQREARMIFWGKVLEEDGYVYVDNYLTLIPETDDIAAEKDLLKSGKQPNLNIEIARTRYLRSEIARTRLNAPLNFMQIETQRAQLFSRQLIVQQRTELRTQPSESAPVIEEMEPGTKLASQDMKGSWFEVRRGSGNALGYVAASTVYVLPHATQPSSQGCPCFSLPAVHFMVGLYHYLAGHYEDAESWFTRFIDLSEAEEDNVNLAIAYQLQGASRLLRKDPSSLDEEDLAAFHEAINLTPYDWDALNLLVLARFAIQGELDSKDISKLEESMELNVRDNGTHALVRNLDKNAGTEHKNVAKDLKKLRVTNAFERIRHKPYVSMSEKAIQTASAPTECPTMTIENHTGSTVLFYYKRNRGGPGDKEVYGVKEVPANENNLACVKEFVPGRYEIAIEIPADPLIRPLYAEQHDQPKGPPHVLKLYVRWHD